MTKTELRQLVRQRKAECRAEFPRWSDVACRRLAAMPRWQQSRCVLLYHALPDEPQLAPLLDEARMAGKCVLLPVVVGDNLVLRQYTGADSLQEGAFRILEPDGDDFPVERYADIDLALVPGMAFDREGHRLGRGKGYYDRLLPLLSRAHKVGVCFPFQLFDEVPHEMHDVPMDSVL